MLLNKLTAFAALAVALVATQVAETHPHALALNALLGKRQQTRPPTDTTPVPVPSPSPVPTPSPTPTNGADNGDQASAPTGLPAGLAPFQDASNLTAWQVLELHPSFTNVSSIARAHSPAVVAALNSTDPGTNLTVFAPYNPAFEALVNQPLFQFANSTDRYNALISQALAYHVSNATAPDGGAIYTDDIPPQPGNLTVPTLAGNLNVTLQRANERPAPPVQISQETITVPSPTITVPSPTITVPSPTITLPVTVVRPTGNTTPTQTATATATDGAGAGVGGPLPTQGEGVYANDAQIIYANLTLANGVLHVVDRLVSPLFIFNNPDIIGTVLPTTLPTAQPTATATTTA